MVHYWLSTTAGNLPGLYNAAISPSAWAALAALTATVVVANIYASPCYCRLKLTLNYVSNITGFMDAWRGLLHNVHILLEAIIHSDSSREVASLRARLSHTNFLSQGPATGLHAENLCNSCLALNWNALRSPTVLNHWVK